MERKNLSKFLFVALSLLLVSCSEYAKVLSSTDSEYKLTMAKKYYDEGECDKAFPLFDELLKLYKGTTQAEEVYYYYSSTHYCRGEYLNSAYHFKTFGKTFEKSAHLEEGAYMVAMSYYQISPESNLDQSYTQKAIDEFKFFMTKYPNSDRVDICKNHIAELENKLELKSIDISRQYYQIGKYKAAIRSFNLNLQNYTETVYKEEIKYKLVLSHYRLAMNSIASKKKQRLKDTLIAFQDFTNTFTESNYLDELLKVKRNVEKLHKSL